MLERDTNSLERFIKHGGDFGFHLSCFCSYKTCSRGILLLLMSVRRLVNLGGMPQTFCIVHRIQLTLRSTFLLSSSSPLFLQLGFISSCHRHSHLASSQAKKRFMFGKQKTEIKRSTKTTACETRNSGVHMDHYIIP